MRKAITIITIIGVLLTIGLGIKWISDYNDYKETLSSTVDTAESLGIDLSSELKDVEKAKNCSYVLIACGIVALASVILLGKLKKITGIILLLSAIVPAVIYPGTLIVTFLFIISGLLAFFAKPKTKTA